MSRGLWQALVGLWFFCALSSQALGQTLSFLDESGAPTSVYVEKARVYLQVTDPAANVSPAADTVEVRLSTALGGDVELVTLTETGTSTGVFRGDVALAQKGGAAQPGVLETDTLRVPPYGRDTISADYDNGAATATASLAGSSVKFLDLYGRPVARFAVGEIIFIRVVAPLRNTNSVGSDQISLHLTAGNGSDDEWLYYIVETGSDTGVFQTSILTTGNPPVLGDGTLEVTQGQAVQATVEDPDLPTSSQADATMAASSVELTDAQGKPAPFYLESTRAYVRLRDTAADLNPSVRDTTTVQMTADLSGDQETVTLQETGTSTGIFEGSVPLRRGPGVPGNGTLETTASSGASYRFDTLHATHADGAGNSTDAVDMIGSITSFRDGYGNEVTSYAAGARVYLQVEDHNFDDPSRFDTVTATVQSPGSGDAEAVTLVETGRDTGIFEGSIPTRTSASGSGDGVLAVQPGQTILAQHVDANNVLASGAQAAVQSFDIRFIEAAGEPTVELLEGGTARVRVTGPAANVNPNLAETVTVHLQTLDSQDQEDLTLTETGPDTGVFEGSIRLDNAQSGTPYNGILETGNDRPQSPIHLDQVTATFAGAGTTAQMAGSRVWFIDDYGRVTTSFPVGANVGVRVEEPAIDNPGGTDLINYFRIDVQDGNFTNTYTLSLQETGISTGIFEGSMPSSSTGGGSYVIRGAPGLTLQAISWDASTSSLATANAVFTGGQMLFVDAQGQPASVYLEGTRAYVRAIDHQRTGSVAVTVASAVTGDQETLTLVETSAGSGVFEGSIGLRKAGSATPGNGMLETGEQTAPVHAFDTLRASYTDASGGVVSATVATLGYRVWFLDAYGNVVSSYPQGAQAYVRIEWHNSINPNTVDSLGVRLRSAAGDLETIQATETGRDTGIFETSIPLDSSGAASAGDGRLQAPPGAWISADRAGAAAPMPVYAQIDSASVQFIDDAGRPTTAVLRNGTARVRVVSPADDHSSTTVETLTVQMSSRDKLDVETVTLTETGRGTGAFEGAISLLSTPSSAVPGNGVLETKGSGYYDPNPEELTALFGGYSATARVIASRIVFIDDLGRETAIFPVGTNVGVRVIEPASNHPGWYDLINDVEIHVQGGSTYYLNLNETGQDTGVFEGRIQSSSSGSYGIPAAPGTAIQAVRTDPFTFQMVTAQATFTGGQVSFVDAQGQPASVYLEETRAYLKVEDHLSSGPRNAQVTTALSGDQETVTLQETSVGSGIFLGSIDLSLSNSASPGNGRLETGESFGPPFRYETLYASYTGPANTASTATATTLGYRVWFLDAAGAVVNSYLQGSRAYVRLEDHNYNNPNFINTLYVQLTSSSGDEEFLEVTETGLATGIYEGSIPLDLGAVAAGDGRLQAPAGGEITADRHGAWFPAPVRAGIDGAVVEFTDAAGQKTVELLENGMARVRVYSGQDNLNPASADSIVAQLHSRYANDQENLTLTETGPDTGIFEGSIRLLFNGTQAAGNGMLETRLAPGHELEEVTATFGAYSSTAHDALQQLAFLNLRGQVVSSYSVGSQINVRVLDLVDSQTDSLYMTMSSSGLDNEDLWLGETGPGTGVFLASIPSTDQPGSSYDRVLSAPAGQVVQIQTSGFYGPSPTAQATMTSFAAPVAQNDEVQVAEGTQVSFDVLANDVHPSGPLSVAQYTQPRQGSVTFDSQGLAVYTSALGSSGSDFFTYLAVDPQGGETLGYVLVTITPANRPPVANDDTATLDEDGTVEIPVLANDSDPVGLGLLVVIASAPAHGTVFVTSDQTVVYTPAPANYNGSDSFTYSVSDGNNGTATATVTITVTPVNDPPVAYADSATVAEDGTVSIAVLANDTDVENDVLTVTAVTQGAHGAVVIDPDNTVRYTPAANYNGSDAFLYTVSDGNGGSATGTVTITVTSLNDAPVANADSATVAEDGTVNVAVLANDTDADGDTLSVASVTQGTHGTVAINPDKTVKYTPAANYNGSDSFTYTVSDGNGGSATGTVTITVTSVNDAPVANADAATVAEDGTVNVAVLTNDTDADGDTLSVSAVTQGTHGTVAINPDKTVKYTPAANYNGSDSFTYTVSDGNGGSATGTVTITVTSVNDAPVANADAATVAEDGTVNVAILTNDTDADGDTLSVSAVTQGTHGTVAINPDKTVKYTPAANYNGSDSFTYTVSDSNGGTATGAVTVTVTSVNDAPVANADSATVAEDGTVNIAVLTNDTDADGDTLSVTSVTQGAHGTVAINPDKTVKYTPAANYNGSDSFTYTVSDGNGGTATGAVTVTVTSVNDAPVANADSATVAEDGTVNVAVLGNDTDADGDTLSVASVTQGTHGTVAINPDKTVKYTPAANYNGSDSFTYTVSDGNGGTATGTVTITVTSVNDAPVANADAATVAEDGTVNVAVLTNDTDADGDTLSVTSVTQGAHGTVAINPDKTVKHTPAANYNGSDSFTYTVSDGNGGSATGTVTITVTSVNDAPVANADAATVAEDGTVNVAVLTNDTDADGDTLSVSAVTQGTHGAVAINPDKTVKYTPAANYNGSDSFTYTVSDGNGGTATGAVTVTVTSVNDAPVANADSATVAEDGTVNVAVLANDTDADGDTLSVASVTQGAHGTVAINPDKTVKYTPAANYNGSDSFTYTVSDGNGGTATGTVTATVTAVNDAPVANADSATVAEDGTINIAVLGNDTDADGDTLSVASITQGAHGTVAINPDKTVKYTPAANYNGSDSFTYTVSDGNGGSATGTVVINVTPVNDPPVAVNDSASVVAGSAVTVSVLANDADVDGPGLAVASVTQGAHGTVVINANQTVTYTAALYVGTDSFTYTVADGAGGTATATVNVTITAPPRVATGIQARYDFNEGSGSTVNDTSGVGTPLNLTIASPSSVTWISGGLRVNTATAISTSGVASKIISAAQASNEITVEAWVSPSSLTLTGPAHIAMLMKNATQRNLIFGQSGSRYETQLKTSTGTASLQSPASSLTQTLTHVVYTRSSSGAAIWYINGVQVSTQTTTGNFSSWGTDQKLTLSDNWQGSYYLLAVYGRALSSTEVQQNYLAGAN